MDKMFICLGYNVSESSLNKYFKDRIKNKTVRITGVRALDLDTFETLNLSLDDIVENRLGIGGSALDYIEIEKSVYVYVGAYDSIEYFQGEEYNLVSYESNNLSRPVFCNGKLVDGFPNNQSFRSNYIVNYRIGYLDLYINTITSGVLVKACEFELLNINYKGDELSGLSPRFSCNLDSKKFSISALNIYRDGNVEYINNILAYIERLSYEAEGELTYVVSNGVKYIAIGNLRNSFTLVVPTSVEDIHLVNDDIRLDKRYKILVSLERYSLLVDKIYNSLDVECDGEGLAKKLKIIKAFNIEVDTYG